MRLFYRAGRHRAGNEPELLLVGRNKLPPDGGGNTLFANMYRAYETLSDPIKKMLAGLTAQFGTEEWTRVLALGVYLHGLAAERAPILSGRATAEGDASGLLAGEVAEALPAARAERRPRRTAARRAPQWDTAPRSPSRHPRSW